MYSCISETLLFFVSISLRPSLCNYYFDVYHSAFLCSPGSLCCDTWYSFRDLPLCRKCRSLAVHLTCLASVVESLLHSIFCWSMRFPIYSLQTTLPSVSYPASQTAALQCRSKPGPWCSSLLYYASRRVLKDPHLLKDLFSW